MKKFFFFIPKVKYQEQYWQSRATVRLLSKLRELHFQTSSLSYV